MDGGEDLVNALGPVKAVFETLGTRFFVGGSVASSYHGAMRSTMDVDLVAELKNSDIAQIMSSVTGEYYASEPAIRDAIQRQSSFNLIHLSTSFKVDVFISRGRPFDLASFKRSAIRRLGTTDNWVEVPVASVEDTLLAKLEWYRAGNEASERQWDDVSRLVKLNFDLVDWGYLNRTADELEIQYLLDRLKNTLA